MILELGISELNALILLLDDQGAGAISAEDGLGQNVSGRISQAVLLAASQLDDLVLPTFSIQPEYSMKSPE